MNILGNVIDHQLGKNRSQPWRMGQDWGQLIEFDLSAAESRLGSSPSSQLMEHETTEDLDNEGKIGGTYFCMSF